MKENVKYSLFFGVVFTVVLTLAYGNWYGFAKITVMLVAEIFLFMTILSMIGLGLASRTAGRRMEELKGAIEDELYGEEDPSGNPEEKALEPEEAGETERSEM